jgi:hypothetical protein
MGAGAVVLNYCVEERCRLMAAAYSWLGLVHAWRSVALRSLGEYWYSSYFRWAFGIAGHAGLLKHNKFVKH